MFFGVHQLIFLPGQLPPGQLPPDNYPQDNWPPDNCYLGQLLPSQLPPRTIAPRTSPPDTSHLGLLYCPLDNYTQTITAQSNDNYKLQFFSWLFFVSFPWLNYIIFVFCYDNKNNNDKNERYYPVTLTKGSQLYKKKKLKKIQ